MQTYYEIENKLFIICVLLFQLSRQQKAKARYRFSRQMTSCEFSRQYRLEVGFQNSSGWELLNL